MNHPTTFRLGLRAEDHRPIRGLGLQGLQQLTATIERPEGTYKILYGQLQPGQDLCYFAHLPGFRLIRAFPVYG